MDGSPVQPIGEVRPVAPGAKAARRLVVVLPVYNEADSISAVLGEVLEAAERLTLIRTRTTVVLVDDRSPDGTGHIAREFADEVGLDLHTVGAERAGLGKAMLHGLERAMAFAPDAIVTLDGDGQHNPTDIPTLYRAFLARQADMVIGSRWVRGGRAPGMTPGRILGSRAGNGVFRLVTGTRGVQDATTSFRVYSPRVARFLLATDSARYTGYSFFSTTVALAEAAGYTISEVPIEFRPRYGGQSKLNRAEVRRYFATLPSLREERRRYQNGGPESPDGGPQTPA
jgi:dolichol-phosphate mannosyltransferase